MYYICCIFPCNSVALFCPSQCFFTTLFECTASAHWGESQGASPVNQPDACGRIPFMDHWNAPRPHVSLRDIIKEEQALQENVEKVTLASIHILISSALHTPRPDPPPHLHRNPPVPQTRQGRADLDRRDGAALLKEDQLFSLFPTIDRHFLQDIFRDHKYKNFYFVGTILKLMVQTLCLFNNVCI